MEADEAGNDGEAQRDEGSGSGGSPVTACVRKWSLKAASRGRLLIFCKSYRLPYIPDDRNDVCLGAFNY
jgi:hypothetical protein